MSHYELVNGVPVVGSESDNSAGGAGEKRAPRIIVKPELISISHLAVQPPLDYSFQEIKTMTELPDHEPNGFTNVPQSQSPKKDAASPASAPAAGGAASASSPSSTTVAGRKNPKNIISGVRLCYNLLTNLNGFAEAIEAVLGPDAKTNLTWLDLSHNQLTTVPDVLLTYPNLSALYLHGNQISSLSEIKKLNVLSHLQKFTIHGNPIYQPRTNHGLKNPRSGIVYSLRDTLLKSLDFSTITNADRRNALRWAEYNKPKKVRRKEEGDGEGEGR